MASPGQSSSKERLTLLSFGVRQPVAANLLMMVIIIMGVVFGLTLRRSMFPDIKANRAAVTIIYPGASPDEVEDGVVVKVEDKLADLDDVDEISSSIVEGGATVMIKFRDGLDDIDTAVNDVKSALDTIDDLPDEAKELRTQKFDTVLPVITVNMVGDVSEFELKRALRTIRSDLESLPEMGEVEIYGVRDDEIRVEVDPDVLNEYHLSITDISDTIRRYMAETPGGIVRSAREAVRIRTMGTDETAASIRKIIVKTDPEGSVVRLGDIASVRDGFADQDLRARLNGKPAASATIVNKNNSDTVDIAELVRAYADGVNGEEFQPNAVDRWASIKRSFASLRNKNTEPRGNTSGGAAGVGGAEAGRGDVGGADHDFIPLDQLSPRERAYRVGMKRAGQFPGEIILSNDLARFIESRLDLLLRNALWGAILVFLILLLTLNVRVALWVMSGLVVSLLGTLAFMAAIGITLNLLTMFGLIIVLGLLVDDAIVVAENIITRYENGEPPIAAAINGTKQIAWPVVATVTTTIAAFLPLRLIHGQIGDFLGALPLVVACALSVSLMEAMIILPAHMAHTLLRAEKMKPGRFVRAFRGFEERRNDFIQNVIIPGFAHLVERVLRYRYIATAIAFTIWILSIALVLGGRVPFTFFPTSDSELFVANLRMPVGTSIDATDAVIRRIEKVCVAQPEARVVSALVGTELDTNDWNTAGLQPHIAQLMVELKPVEERDIPCAQIISRIREQLGVIPGISSLRFEELQGGPGGQAINFLVSGDDINNMKVIAGKLKEELNHFDGVYDIADDLDQGQREIRFSLRDGAASLGLTPQFIARQIRGALYGMEPHTFAANREDVKVRLSFVGTTRRSLSQLERIFIFTPTGRRVPLAEVVHINEATGYANIKRFNRKRAVTVLADVDQAVTNPEIVVAAMKPYFAQLENEFPGISIEARGRQLETQKSLAGIKLGFLLASVMIYVILAWLFQSYFQPIAVMLAIPFSMIGVVWGHYLTGYDMMILSLIGFVALVGIIVNDSLIYMEFYNHRRSEGVGIHDALVETSRRRLRPIVLTTVTTVLGLLPLMLETSFQAKFLIPMAIAIAFGLMSATILTLLVLPCLVFIGDDLRKIARYLWYGRKASQK